MKMVLAIVSSDDASSVMHGLMKERFSATRLSSTGGFLRSGNVTVLVGVEEDKVQTVIDIISRHSKSRKVFMPAGIETTAGISTSVPMEVTVGGATVFVLDVERFEKV